MNGMAEIFSTRSRVDKLMQTFSRKPTKKMPFGRSKGILGSNIKVHVTISRLGGCALDSSGSG
jgi:hypothetical protein